MQQGDFSRYNDYELLYLANANIDEAQEILLWKYSFLIKSRIASFHISKEQWDDFYQEGCLMLFRAIKKFDQNMRSSFTNFFDLLLKRRFITLLKKNVNDFNCIKQENFDDVLMEDEKSTYEIVDLYNYGFSDLEQIIYDKALIKGYKITDLAKELHLEHKSLYNAKQRVLSKLKKRMKLKS